MACGEMTNVVYVDCWWCDSRFTPQIKKRLLLSMWLMTCKEKQSSLPHASLHVCPSSCYA